MRHLLWCLPLLAAFGLATAGCSVGPAAPAGFPADDARSAGIDAEEVKDDTRKLADAATLERLARTDPIAFLQESLRRHDREVRGYTATLVKQERVAGSLQEWETVAVSFREKPFSVLMEWQEGARLATKTLYVQGENDNQLVVKPTGRLLSLLTVRRDPHGSDAKKSARYPVTEFGIKIGTRRALAAWKAAQQRGEFRFVFGGQKKVEQLGGRLCWELKRVGYARPEDDGITASTFYFDKENALQVGSILEGDGELIGSYWFRDLKLNPTFAAATFTPAAVKR